MTCPLLSSLTSSPTTLLCSWYSGHLDLLPPVNSQSRRPFPLPSSAWNALCLDFRMAGIFSSHISQLVCHHLREAFTDPLSQIGLSCPCPFLSYHSVLPSGHLSLSEMFLLICFFSVMALLVLELQRSTDLFCCIHCFISSFGHIVGTWCVLSSNWMLLAPCPQPC